MDNNETKYIPIKDLKVEEGAEDLMDSPLMRPYIEAAKVLLQNKDASSVIAKIAELPLEQRYVWRVASPLKWGFADLDSGSVARDRETLSPEDRKRVVESLRVRPIRFCLFLKALLGADEMQRIMVHAIKAVAYYHLAQVYKALGNVPGQQKALAEFRRIRGQRSNQRETVLFSPRDVTRQELDPNAAP
jgi:hypothetical protein